MMTLEDIEALELFTFRYPTWWYRIGVCDLTRDFTAAPQAHSPEAKYIKINNVWDNGFSCDSTGTLRDAICDVMEQISIKLSNV